MRLRRINDKWQVYCGRIERELIADMKKWCWDSWGSSWGQSETIFDVTVFQFVRRDHASWFIMRWQDSFESP
jgi:hypothetical protein